MYNFAMQHRKGVAAEQMLDDYFAKWFDIRPASMLQQRIGIDRIFTDRRDGRVMTVEYKADFVAQRTGNAFVETVSVDTKDTAGWAYTSAANYLIYYIEGDELVYVFDFAQFREQLDTWQRNYPTRRIPNEGYRTHGLLVPLREFEKYSEAQLSV